MEQTELGRLVGDWTMTAGPPGGPLWPGEARVEFAWLDGAFLIERWRIEAAEALPEGTPTGGTCVLGWDEARASFVQLYFDNRGVHRVYEMGLRDGVWTLERAGPPFGQRFRGVFSADGATIDGRWEIQEPGQAWRVDFDVTYRRRVDNAAA